MPFAGGRGGACRVREAHHPGHVTQVLKPHGHIDLFVCFCPALSKRVEMVS